MDVREKDFKSESMIIVLFNDKIKYNKIKQTKKITLKLERQPNRRKSVPKEDRSIRELLVYIVKISIKILF